MSLANRLSSACVAAERRVTSAPKYRAKRASRTEKGENRLSRRRVSLVAAPRHFHLLPYQFSSDLQPETVIREL
jgi:hypothetical protein